MADCMGASSSSDIVVRTVDDVMVENGPNLTNVIQGNKRRLEAMEFKYKETREAISKLANDNDELHQSYFQEMKEMQFSIQKQFQWICNYHKTMDSKLEMEEKELELRSIEVQKREAINEYKRKKIAKEIEENAASNNLKLEKLADDHKREMEKLHKKIFFLKKQIEVGINQDVYEEMKRSLGTLIAMFHKDAVDVLEEMHTDLNERDEELYELNGITLALRELEQKKNDELTDACKELTEGLRGLPNAYKIRVKRMGELEKKPFYTVMKQKYNEEEALSRADTEYRLWNDHLRDPSWYPFRVITTIDGNLEAVIDENDEKLIYLKREMDVEVYRAVVTALKEMNQHSPYERRVVEVLWNFAKARKATVHEGISCLRKMCRAQKSKRIM